MYFAVGFGLSAYGFYLKHKIEQEEKKEKGE